MPPLFLSVSSPATRLLLKCALGTVHLSSLHFRHFHNHPHLFSTNPEKPTSTIHHLSLKKSGFCFFSPFMFSRTVHLQQHGDEKTVMDRLAVLKTKLEKEGIACDSCKPGQNKMICPQCSGGKLRDKSFSIFIRADGELALWKCFRAKCGWQGHVRASTDGKGDCGLEKSSKDEPYRETEVSLRLQPSCDGINKNERQFHKKGCPLSDDVKVIYGNTTATGENIAASTQGAVDTDKENALGRSQNITVQGTAVDHDDGAYFVEEALARAQSVTLRQQFKETSSFDQACMSIADYYRKKVASLSNSVENDDPFSIKNCVVLLSTIPNVNEEIYLKAFKVIGSNRNWRELFMSAPESIRPLMLTPSELDHYL